MRFLRNRSYRPTTFPSGPRKSASISKRIPNVWMLLHGRIQSPSPGPRLFVNSSPLKRETNVSATRIPVPTMELRVLFQAAGIRLYRGKTLLLLAGPSGSHVNIDSEDDHKKHHPWQGCIQIHRLPPLINAY